MSAPSADKARLKPLGVLGGMGPAATADFMAKLTRATGVERDQDHIPCIVTCLPDIPDRTGAILEKGPSPLPAMLRSLAILEGSGVGRIAIPCNTAHYWFDDLQREASIPLIHMVDAVKRLLAARGLLSDRIGLLATTATVRANIYANRLALDGIRCIVPTNEEQTSVMEVIRHVKGGNQDENESGTLIRALSNRLLRRGASAVILACTELPLVARGDGELVDSTEALALECVRLSMPEHFIPPLVESGRTSQPHETRRRFSDEDQSSKTAR